MLSWGFILYESLFKLFSIHYGDIIFDILQHLFILFWIYLPLYMLQIPNPLLKE